MATHSSVLAWRIPWMEKPGRLQSMGSHRVGHNWSDLAAAAASAYLRLLIFLPAILIPACASSSLAFHMMYSAYKLNKQGDNIQSWRTPFPIWNQSVVPCAVLSVASWPAYRFLKSLNHTKTIPTLHPHPQKNCLPWNWSLVPKSVGSAPLGVPLKRAALILMLWQADYPRGLVGLGGPWPSRLPGLTLWGLLLAVCG